MDKLITNFSAQLTEALTIGKEAKLSKPAQGIQNIVVSGLGGSGIGGNLTAEITEAERKVPFIVNKDYFIPGFVDEHSLVIISSYSGNTEETLNAFQMALDQKARITCVTSGGKVEEMANKHGLDLIKIPGGMPPRACLGYSFVQQLFILKHHGLIKDKFIQELESAVKLMDREEDNIRELAQTVASRLVGKIPIIYVESSMEAVAIRVRQQLNENAKVLCWHHVIPEMNHNELVGWRTKDEAYAVILLRNETDYERNQRRMNINKEIIEAYTSTFIELNSKGSSKLERSLYLIHLLDWVSYYLAQARDMDAVEVDVIDRLKGELAGE